MASTGSAKIFHGKNFLEETKLLKQLVPNVFWVVFLFLNDAGCVKMEVLWQQGDVEVLPWGVRVSRFG